MKNFTFLNYGMYLFHIFMISNKIQSNLICSNRSQTGCLCPNNKILNSDPNF